MQHFNAYDIPKANFHGITHIYDIFIATLRRLLAQKFFKDT